MKPSFSFILALVCFSLSAVAQTIPDSVELKIVLVGDAGAFTKGTSTAGSSLYEGWHPVMTAIRKNVPMNEKTVVLFLGDNVYKEGLPDDQLITYSDAKAVLDSQINIVNNTKAKAIFIPGNHDWSNGARSGYENVKREQQYVDLLSRANVMYYPKDGCPGPIEVPVSDNVVIIVMDSQWWLHPNDKPGIESDCDSKTKDQILNELDDLLLKNQNKLVLFATHHPFKSTGIHGGYFTLKQHIFPFTDANKNWWIPMPIIGSIYPITRSVFGTRQDLSHPWYREMVKKVSEIIKKHENVVYVAGHEHNMQLIEEDSTFYIVSGAGCKHTRVSPSKQTLFAREQFGYAILTVSKNKNVDISFHTVALDDAATDTAYNAHLFNFVPRPKALVATDTATEVVVAFKDSAVAIANPNYDKVRGFHRFLLGENYRKEWATPVRMKTFNLKKEKGGFTIVKVGGGKQTKSLRLKDKHGKEWVLRTITKDPHLVVPENFRNTIAEDLVQDFMSASHPYAPLTVAPLVHAIDVQQSVPELFFVPDDAAFGIYRKIFANKICFLEERAPTEEKTKSTAKTFEKLIDDNDHRVDQKAVLRARLLDIIIGDFDRHFDQWRFEQQDTGKGKLFVPVPRDRDQAYFYDDGFLLKLVTLSNLKFLKGFTPNIKNINWFGYSAKDFDRIFLNQLDAADWEEAIHYVQKKLTDSLFLKTTKLLPPEIYKLNGNHIYETLVSRRNQLQPNAVTYYNFISKYVTIAGSNKKDYFRISGEGSNVKVEGFKRKGTSDTVSQFYNRVFDPGVTKEIRIFGMNDDDIFEMLPGTPNSIRIRIVGGKGNDTFDLKGDAKTFVYDVNSAGNFIANGKNIKNKFSDDPLVNSANFTNFQYDVNRFPLINLGWNAEDQLLVGVGFQHKHYGFRKEPYAWQQKLSSLFATDFGSYKIDYAGEFNHLIHKTDVVVNASFVHPTLNNFFGIGNETQKAGPLSYYRVRYNYVTADVLLRRRPFDLLHITAGPTIYNYWLKAKDNAGKILEAPSLVGLDTSVYSTKTYGGFKIGLLINNLENHLLPTRGIDWYTEFVNTYGLNDHSKNYSAITSDMKVYAAMNDPAKFVTVVKLGVGHIFSDNYEYFQAMSIGQNSYLRGFRKNRFSGSTLFYSSLEFRIKLFESKWPVLPGAVGIVAFDDVGRVWAKNENSKTWHNSIGGGLYIAPFNSVILSATTAFSREETLFNITLGTKFNLTF